MFRSTPRGLGYAAILAASSFSSQAYAACQNASSGDAYNPASGEAVYCNANAPAVDTQSIQAVAGSTGVSVTIDSGAGLDVAGGPAVQVETDSTVSNQGTITAAGAAGVSLAGDGNGLVNDGIITGTIGVVTSGNGNVVVNRGDITGTGGTAVSMGNGDDSFAMEGGTVTGAVDQGQGANTMTVSSGTVTGSVNQRDGVDHFEMTGGQIGMLEQGNGRDTFVMTGGHIVGGFDDGDVATMTGGTIGRVNMKLDNNIFDMSGGTIEGNLVTGLGLDEITVSGGYIGGNISVSSGVDQVAITGGRVENEVRMGQGDDIFTWADGGTIGGRIDLNDDNDTATLRNLGLAETASTAQLDGGSGTDSLVLDNAIADGVSRFVNWESVDLRGGARLSLDGDLLLGDAGTGTGTLAIGAGSTLQAVSGVAGAVSAMGAGQMASVTNAGTIDLGGGNARNRLTINGDYTGSNGSLNVDTVLGGDDAPSDRLIVSGGTISGTTGMRVNNLGGAGAATPGSGIMVVQATNGTISDAGAFSLLSNVKAGAYQYFLYKGGVTAGTENNWYLRSSVPAAPAAGASAPVPAASTPVALPAPAAQAVPIYRREVPVYGAVAATSRQLALLSLGTFHDRQGEQSILEQHGRMPASWARVYGVDTERHYGGDSQAEFDGTIGGMQIGTDLYAWRRDNGHRDRVGAFLGYARADGDVRGMALATPHTRSGDLAIDGYSLGGYWTHVGPSGWYADAVAMVTWLSADMHSRDGIKESTDGTATTLSLEGGYPYALTEHLTLEPQAQFIAQFLSVDAFDDGISHVSFDDTDAYTGRVGLRLKGDYTSAGGTRWEPYVRANLWHEFSGTDRTKYDGSAISTEYGATTMQMGAGLVARLNDTVSVYAAADYLTDVSGDYRRDVMGNLGVRITW